MLVKKYKLGNTTIEIHDDAYKDKTQEDIDKILERVGEIASRALIAQEQRKEL